MSKVAPNIDCGVQGVRWSTHARQRWSERSACPGRDLGRVWREAVRVDYPSARDGAVGWAHDGGDVVLLVTRDRAGDELVVTTVIELDDRPVEERAYVRAQVVHS